MPSHAAVLLCCSWYCSCDAARVTGPLVSVCLLHFVCSFVLAGVMLLATTADRWKCGNCWSPGQPKMCGSVKTCDYCGSAGIPPVPVAPRRATVGSLPARHTHLQLPLTLPPMGCRPSQKNLAPCALLHWVRSPCPLAMAASRLPQTTVGRRRHHGDSATSCGQRANSSLPTAWQMCTMRLMTYHLIPATVYVRMNRHRVHVHVHVHVCMCVCVCVCRVAVGGRVTSHHLPALVGVNTATSVLFSTHTQGLHHMLSRAVPANVLPRL